MRKGIAKGIALFLVAAIVATMAPPAGAALPQGGQLQRGEASWQYDGDVLQVEQRTNRVVIDWEAFTIGAENTVKFVQPGVDAAALNRVVGDDPSHLFGKLEANGRVFLVNPHGVIFGPDASVDVGSLVASALWLDVDVGDNNTFWDADASAKLWEDGGRLVFERRNGDGPADVVNMGRIIATGDDGYIVLLGPALVRNEGVLATEGARHQMVGLAAGGRVRLTDAVVPDADNFWDDDLWSAQPRRFVVDEATAEALIETTVESTIDTTSASDNMVLLTAAGAKALHQSVINQQGLVMAKRMEAMGGPKGTVRLGGTYEHGNSWDFTYAAGERIALDDDGEGPTVISGSGPGMDQLVLDATEEIAVVSDVVYRNYGSSPLGWSFMAPTIKFHGDVKPYDEHSAPIDQRPDLWIVNKGDDPLTVTSDEASTLALRYLQIDVGDDAVVDMAGALDSGEYTYVRSFGSPDVVRFSNRANRFGQFVELAADGSIADPDGTRTLRAREIVVHTSDEPLHVTGSFHGTETVFLWNDGGDVVLWPSARLTTDGLLTIAATGGGVFINEAGADVFGAGGEAEGRVRIYSSSDAGGYNPGGLEAWEYDKLVEFLDNPAAGHAIYFLDELGALIVVVGVTAPGDGSFTYGQLSSGSPFEVKYYLQSNPSVAIDATEVEELQLRIVGADGRVYTPAEWNALGVGEYDVEGHGARSKRYRLTYEADKVVIVPAPLTITVGGTSRYYGEGNGVLRFVDVGFAGWARSEDDRDWQSGTHFTLTSAGEGASVGTYDIVLSEFRDDLAKLLRNYDVTMVYDDAFLHVLPRPVTVQVSDFTRLYGDDNDFTDATFQLGSGGLGLALGHTLADIGFEGDPNDFLTSVATARSGPGTYAIGVIKGSLGGQASNYDVTVVGDLVVTKRPVTVGAGHKTVTYLDPVQITIDNPVIVSDLGKGRDIHFLPDRIVLDALPTPTVGEYVVTWAKPAEGWEDDVYDITFVDGTLTVIPRPIVVELGDVERLYGDDIRLDDVDVRITNIPESTPWFAPRVTVQMRDVSARSDVGLYEGAVGAVVDNPNFTPTIRPGNLTVKPRPLSLQAFGSRTYGDSVSSVPFRAFGLAAWHEAGDVVADVTTRSLGTERQAAAGAYAAFIDGYRLINDNYVVEDVLDGVYRVEKRPLWVAVGDIAYHSDERKPYPAVRFDNLAPFDRQSDMMTEGCLMWLPNPGGRCDTAFHGGDVNDPYYMFDRAQQGRYRNGTWGRADAYTGPWQWAFHIGSEALRNYNVVESRLGYETIRPALSREEIIDIVLNDRPRDEIFQPETSFEPPPPVPVDDPFGSPVVIDDFGEEFTYDIVDDPDHVGGVPKTCLIPTNVEREFLVNGTCVKAHEALDGFTAGLPDESQDILINALANWLDTTRDGLTATALAEAYAALQAGADWIMEDLFPFLLVEFYDILEKDEADLTPGERAYVEHVAAIMHKERQLAAERAVQAYRAWEEGNDKMFEGSPNLLSSISFGRGMPDYLKNAASAAELGIYTQGGPNSRKTGMILSLGSLGAGIIGGIGGGSIGALGVLQPLTSVVFPFAARAGEAAVMLSGVSLGGAVLGALAFVATAVTTVVIELVDRDNVRKKINKAVEVASGPPPTFADLKAMKATEEGELQLMMHAMTAFDQYAPGGPLHNIAQGMPVPVGDTAYLPD